MFSTHLKMVLNFMSNLKNAIQIPARHMPIRMATSQSLTFLVVHKDGLCEETVPQSWRERGKWAQPLQKTVCCYLVKFTCALT